MPGRKRSYKGSGRETKYGPDRKVRRRTGPYSRRRRNLRTAGFLGIETKFHDTALIGAVVPAAGNMSGAEVDPATFSCLNGIAQGSDESQRDGRKVTNKSIHVRGYIHRVTADMQAEALEAAIVSVWLVKDMQTNGAQLNSEDVFVNPSNTAQTAAQPFNNLEFSSRFKVLAHKMVTIDTPNMSGDTSVGPITDTPVARAAYLETTTQGGAIRRFEFHVPLNETALYNGPGATVGDVVNNSYHIIANGNITGNFINYNCRLRFIG